MGFDTPEFKVGDEVRAYGRHASVGVASSTEYMTHSAHAVAHTPQELSFEEATALPLTGGTALRAVDSLDLTSEQTLFIHNGAGGVGQTAIQIAKTAGVRVLAIWIGKEP